MALDKFDGTMPLRTRDQIRDDYIRDYKVQVPEADGSENTSLWAEACAFADAEIGNSFIAERVIDAQTRKNASTEDLDDEGNARGCPRMGEGKSTGYVTLSARSGGGFIAAGTVLKPRTGSPKYVSLIAGTYTADTPLPIQAQVAGPSGNLDPGTELVFESPPAGFGAAVSVFENADGTGLTGGAPAETNEAYAKRIESRTQVPPSALNEAHVVALIEGIRGLAIEKGYAYPAIRGPGTYGAAFTMRPAAPGASRIPNGAQLAVVQQVLDDACGDDSVLLAEGIEHDVRVSLGVTWASGAPGWVNFAPWPEFATNDPVHVTSAVAIAVSGFRITSSDSITAPSVGKVIGVYNTRTRKFARKTIATVTQISANHTYDLTFDMTTPGASDLSFVPANGAVVSPWSDSMDDVVTPVLAYVDGQGPGEQVSSFGDPGKRERRFPPPGSGQWPNKIENRIADSINDLAVVSDAEVLEPDVPSPTTVGTPGTIFYLHRVSDLAVYPQT